MSPVPTAVRPADARDELTFIRTFRAPIDDVWASITELTFIHHMSTDIPVGEVGPGWEYYLDLLVASRDGGPRPEFDDYYPAQKAYFEGL